MNNPISNWIESTLQTMTLEQKVGHLLMSWVREMDADKWRSSGTPLGKWGWKLFARKGNRNIAVAAIARKLLVQVWHLLSGNPVLALEEDKKIKLKLQKLALAIGATSRKAMGLGKTITDCIDTLLRRCSAQDQETQKDKLNQLKATSA